MRYISYTDLATHQLVIKSQILEYDNKITGTGLAIMNNSSKKKFKEARVKHKVGLKK